MINKIRLFKWSDVRHWFADLVVGGQWGQSLVRNVRLNLYWFWFDGLFASGSDNIAINYLSLYILALGATQAQIGLMSSFSNLTAAILLMPGALLVERFGRRKMVALSFGLVSRLALLALVFVPILFKGSGLVWIAIGLSVTRDAFANLGYPAWMSVSSEIVPMEGRGRYFGSRNFVMGTSGILVTLLVGQLITVFVQPLGYQIAIALAFVLGIISTWCFSRINDIQDKLRVRIPEKISLRSLVKDVFTHRPFVILCAITALWNFFINVSGPFFNVHMVQDLNFTASMIGIQAVASSLSGLAIQRRTGQLSDRYGPRRVQLWSMFLIPLLPLAWIFARELWHVVLINTFGGLVWGAFNLATFNLLLAFVPKSQVPRYSAFFQVLVTLSMALGAFAGSFIVLHWGFVGVVLTSGIGRYVAVGLFAWLVRDPVVKKAELESLA
jgi:MFS family permease